MFGKKNNKTYREAIEYLTGMASHSYLCAWEFDEGLVHHTKENAARVHEAYYGMIGVARFISYHYGKTIEEVVSDVNEDYNKGRRAFMPEDDYIMNVEWFKGDEDE